jgi:S-layer homology domain.
MKLKKAISALLVCVMVFAMLPLGVISVSAADPLSLSLSGNSTADSGGTYTLTITLAGLTSSDTNSIVNVSISCSPQFTIVGSSTLIMTEASNTATATFNVNKNASGSGTVSAQITSATIDGDGVAYTGAAQTQPVTVRDAEKPTPSVSFARGITSTIGNLTACADESATLYYLVSTSTSVPTPSTIISNGSSAPLTTNSSNIPIAVLSTECYIYYYAKDKATIPNQSDIQFIHVDAYASASNVPGVTVSFTRTGQYTGTLSVTSDKAGYFYYIVNTSSTTPSTNETSLVAGTKTINLSSLPQTATTVWFITKDSTRSFSSGTGSCTIPAYTSATTPTATVISFTRTGSTTGTLSVSSNMAGIFYYALGTSSTTPNIPVAISAGTNTIYLASLPPTATYIWYKTTDSVGANPSSINYYSIPAYSSATDSAVTVLSSSRSGTLSTSVDVTLNVNSQCVLYYGTSSTSITTGPYVLYNTGTQQIQLTNVSTSVSVIYYYTISSTGVTSSTSSFVIGSTSTSGTYPVLSNYSLYSTVSGYGTFSYTADKAGNMYYIVSTNPVYTIDTTGSSLAQIYSGTNSFIITDYTLSLTGAKMYFVTVDVYGNKSSVQSIALNSSSTTTNYPTLTNVYFSVSTLSPYSGTLTFTSNMAGYLCYGPSLDTNATKSTLAYSTPIVQGSNSITISNYTTSLLTMRLYYYTLNSSFVDSPLTYVLPNTASSTTDSTISAVAFTGIVTPVAGKTPSSSYAITNSDSRFTVSNLSWYQTDSLSSASQTKLSSTDKYISGLRYSVTLTLTAKTGYAFPSSYTSFTSTINAKSATLLSYSTSSVTIAYLFDSTATTDGTTITSVAVNGIDVPAAGNTPDVTGITGNAQYKINDITWTPVVTKFASGTSYKVTVTLKPADGYTFKTSGITAKINSLDADIVYISSEGTLLVISYTYKTDGVSSDNWVNPFTDISDSNYYYIYVKYCYLNNLFYGTTSTTFGPTTTMNRAMFVTVLGRLAGVDVTSFTSNKFSDVVSNSWYAPYVAWAVKNGIVLGYDNGKFGPNDPVTREQMCVFLLRYAKYANITLGYSKKTITFTDSAKASSWAIEAISIFEQAGVAKSKPNATGFEPTTNALRQEIAEILILFMMKYMNG